MAATVQDFVDRLILEGRIVVLGGLAVIAHGFNRPTKDADIWFEPSESPEAWAEKLKRTISQFPATSVHILPYWQEVDLSRLGEAVAESRMVRILGLEKPLDIFREANGLDIADFNPVVARSVHNRDGTYLPDPLDLFLSKTDTDREKDLQDMWHLEALVRRSYQQRLPTATLAEATELLSRYSSWQVLRFALANPDPAVQALAHQQLQEFADDGDPFSLAILEGRPIPGEQ